MLFKMPENFLILAPFPPKTIYWNKNWFEGIYYIGLTPLIYFLNQNGSIEDMAITGF